MRQKLQQLKLASKAPNVPPRSEVCLRVAEQRMNRNCCLSGRAAPLVLIFLSFMSGMRRNKFRESSISSESAETLSRMQSDYGSWPRVCLRLPWLPRIRKNLIELLCMRAGEYLDQAGTLEITQLLIANAEKKE